MKQHEEIIGLMKGSTLYTKDTLAYLSDVIADYPYFQAAHILRALNLLSLKDDRFPFALRQAAIYAPDRKQLFFRIENDFFNIEFIKSLEEKTLSTDSTFELIDIFLSKGKAKTGLKRTEIESPPISADYVTYFLSDKAENEEAPPLQYQEIIDQFLEKEAVSPLKTRLDIKREWEDELPEPLSEPVNSDGFFSETLAKIYVKQKRYDKALEIIRKLNLLYPEKNRYFADQIRFLEKLIININKIK